MGSHLETNPGMFCSAVVISPSETYSCPGAKQLGRSSRSCTQQRQKSRGQGLLFEPSPVDTLVGFICIHTPCLFCLSWGGKKVVHVLKEKFVKHPMTLLLQCLDLFGHQKIRAPKGLVSQMFGFCMVSSCLWFCRLFGFLLTNKLIYCKNHYKHHV